MYPRNAASPERIAVGAVVQISDGAVQTTGVSIAVRGQGGASGAGAGTTAYDNGIVEYTPTQGETDFTSFVVIAYKTGCIPVAVTIVTSASATAGYAGTDQSKIANPTSVINLSGTTIKTATDVETDTTDIQSRLPAALVSGRIDASVGAMSAAAVQAIWDALTSALTTIGSIGKLLVDNINATISSRLASASYTAPLDAAGTRAAMGLASSNLDTQLAAIDADVLTRLPTSGYTAPNNANIASIKAQTDKLTFTVAGILDVNTQRIIGYQIIGDGAATPFHV